jgi:hypothetical protein
MILYDVLRSNFRNIFLIDVLYLINFAEIQSFADKVLPMNFQFLEIIFLRSCRESTS